MKKSIKLVLIGIIPILCMTGYLVYYKTVTSPQRKESRYIKFQNERLKFLSENYLKLAYLVNITNQSIQDGYDYILTRDEWFNKYPNSCKDIMLETRKIKTKNKSYENFEKTVNNTQRLSLIKEFNIFFEKEKSFNHNPFLPKKLADGEYVEFKSIFLRNHPYADFEKIYSTLSNLDIEIAKAMYALAIHNVGMELNMSFSMKKDDRVKSFQAYEILYKENFKSDGSQTENKTRYLMKTSIGLICFDEYIQKPNKSPESDENIAILNYYNIPYTDLTYDAVKPIELINPNKDSCWNYCIGFFTYQNSAGLPVYQRMLVRPGKYGGFEANLEKIHTEKVLSNLLAISNIILPNFTNHSNYFNNAPIVQRGFKVTQTQTNEIKKEIGDSCTNNVYKISKDPTTSYTLSTTTYIAGQIIETNYIFKNNKTHKFKQWKKYGPEFFVVTQFGIFSADSDGKIIILDDSCIN